MVRSVLVCGVVGLILAGLGVEASAQDKPGCNLACPMAQRDPATGCCRPAGGGAAKPPVSTGGGGSRRATAPVAFTSTPPGASVWVGEREVCAATPCSANLEVGAQEIEVRGSACLEPHRATLTVRRGATNQVDAALTPRLVALEVGAQEGAAPLAAAVVIDGDAQGSTPGRFEVPLCSERLEVVLAGYEPAAVALNLGVVAVHQVQLKRLPAPVVEAPPEVPAPPLEVASSSTGSVLGWSLLGAGAAGLLGGGVLRWSYQDDVDAIEQTANPAEYDRLRDSLTSQQNLLRGVLGVSGALVVGGAAVLLLWDDEAPAASSALRLSVSPEGWAGSLELRWF